MIYLAYVKNRFVRKYFDIQYVIGLLQKKIRNAPPPCLEFYFIILLFNVGTIVANANNQQVKLFGIPNMPKVDFEVG